MQPLARSTASGHGSRVTPDPAAAAGLSSRQAARPAAVSAASAAASPAAINCLLITLPAPAADKHRLWDAAFGWRRRGGNRGGRRGDVDAEAAVRHQTVALSNWDIYLLDHRTGRLP